MRKPLLAAFLWLALPVAFLSAQQDAPTFALHPPLPAGNYTLHGSVLDSVTRQPVARALVQTGSGDAMLTDSDGEFEFSDVPAGYTSVVVRRPGYISNAMAGGFAMQDPQSQFEIDIGPDMQPLVLLLPPEAIITGQISLLDSDAPDGIQVTAYRKVVENGRPKWGAAGTATTNSEGIFRIANLPPGKYLLYAQPPGDLYGGTDNAAASGYAAVYFPGVTDAAAASVLALTTGQHKQADIALVRQTLYPVTIKIANAPPGNFGGLEISDSGGRPVQSTTRYEPAQQTAHTELPAGRYVVSANTFDSISNTQLVGRTEFTVTSAGVTYVGVTVLPLRSIPVNIRRDFATTEPLEGPTSIVRITGSGEESFINPGISLSLVGADAFGENAVGGLVRRTGELGTRSDDGGSYQLMNVPPGKYWAVADAGQYYISSITSGGVDLTQSVLTVGAGGASAPIEITLRDDGGSIEGTLSASQPESSGEALPFRFVYAIPLFPAAFDPPLIRVQASGKFTFSNLAPGPYRVVACDSLQQIEYRTADGLAAWESKGQVVNVEPGGTAHVQLNLTPTEEQAQ